MSGKKDLIYWDTCIFLAHLKNEVRQDPDDLAGVRELEGKIDKEELQLVTSVITIAEILEFGMPEHSRDKFNRFFQRRNNHLVEVGRQIAEIGHNIRNFYKQNPVEGNGVTIKTPDALHLATAIYMQCNIFYTFDGDGGKQKIRLTKLGPTVAGQYNLITQKPSPTQITLLELPPVQITKFK